jgi:hypothetical protein
MNWPRISTAANTNQLKMAIWRENVNVPGVALISSYTTRVFLRSLTMMEGIGGVELSLEI